MIKYKASYRELVHGIVYKEFGPILKNNDDVIGAAFEGLVKAMAKYDASRGASFETYAYTKILGAVWDYLRSIDSMGRGPRTRFRKLERKRRELEGLLCRRVTRKELSHAVMKPLDYVDRLYRDSDYSNVVMLYQEKVDDAIGSSKYEAPDINGLSFQIDLSKAIEVLTKRERRVIQGHYFDSLTFIQLGKELGVGASRVCQINSEALRKLRPGMQIWAA